MEAYAVIETGGKQFRIAAGDVIDVEKLDAEADTEVTLDQVLAVSDGNDLTIGTPVIPGASVQAKVVDQFRGKKVVSYKKKRRKGYERKQGHRQDLTKLEILDIGTGSKKAAAAKTESETTEA